MGRRMGQGRRIARTFIISVAISVVVALPDAAAGSRQQPQAAAEARASVGDMRLLPGYRHAYGGGDSCTGAIWKDGGERIRYDVGTNAGNHARAFAERPGVAWSRTQQVGKSQLQITMMRDRSLVATVDGMANFSVWNADEQMLVDLLLMLATYDILKHVETGCG
jgi:hypothetical protein